MRINIFNSIIFFYTFIIINLNLNVFANDSLCNGKEISINKVNQHQVFACDGKPGSPYGEINYKFCASRVSSINRIVVPEMFFDEASPCINIINERIVSRILSYPDIQELFLINKNGKYDNFEFFVPDARTKTEANPPKGMSADKCRVITAKESTDYNVLKVSIIFEDSCDPESSAFTVKKVIIQKSQTEIKSRKK
jgi:hypothetical protein